MLISVDIFHCDKKPIISPTPPRFVLYICHAVLITVEVFKGLSELTRLAELTCKLRLHVPGWLKNALRLKMHNTRKIVAKFLLIYIMVCILHVMTSLRIEGSFSRDNFV